MSEFWYYFFLDKAFSVINSDVTTNYLYVRKNELESFIYKINKTIYCEQNSHNPLPTNFLPLEWAEINFLPKCKSIYMCLMLM